MKSSDKHNLIHQEALKRFSKIWETVQDEREQCIEDRRFYSIAGAQWEGKLSRQFEKKPKMEFNKIHLAVIKTINEYRNNRISVDYVSKDGAENQTADICDSLRRADEERCNAQGAYDTAFEEKVGGGMGAWRLVTEYEDESDPDNDRQRIAFKPITDADNSVFFDLDATGDDKLDAKFAFVVTEMTTAGYQEKFNDSPASWPKYDFTSHFDWTTKDTTYVAEYYVKEMESENLHYWKAIGGSLEKYAESELTEEKLIELEQKAATFSHKRKIKKTRVRKYIMSGGGILDDTGYIAGPNIPVVVDYGKRWVVDGIERCMGRVRLAKDAQRVKNVQISQLVLQASEPPTEIPIFASEQMADPVIQNAWANSGVNNPAYLTVNSIIGQDGNILPAGPIGYKKPAQLSPAMVGLMQLTDGDLREILGTSAQGDELKSNLSGEAIGRLTDRMDMADYIYLDNHAKAMKVSGKIWLGMAREVYVEDGRKMKTVGEHGAAGIIELGQPSLNAGKIGKQYDFTTADFDVVTTVGPISSSKKKSTLDTMRGLMGAATDPTDARVLGLNALLNIDGEGSQDLQTYARKQLVSLGAVKPTDEEQEEMAAAAQSQQPDANQAYLMAEAQKKTQEAFKAQADTQKIVAQTQEIQLDTEIKDRESGLNLISVLTDLEERASVSPQDTRMASNQPMIVSE